MFSERQVLALEFLRNTLHVQPQHQNLGWGTLCDRHFRRSFLEQYLNLATYLQQRGWIICRKIPKLEALSRKGGIGSSIIKGPGLENTVFDLKDFLWNRTLKLQKSARRQHFNFDFKNLKFSILISIFKNRNKVLILFSHHTLNLFFF